MKYLVPFAILFLLVISIRSYLKISAASNKLLEFENLNRALLKDSENYLSSLYTFSIDHSNSRVFLTSEDTLELSNIRSQSLFYFFSSNDCNTCVEENIYAIIELAKDNKSTAKYIITAKNNFQHLSKLSRTYNISSLHFGYVLDKSNIPISHYFMILDNGEMTNSYYPMIGRFESTQKYLQYGMKIKN